MPIANSISASVSPSTVTLFVVIQWPSAWLYEWLRVVGSVGEDQPTPAMLICLSVRGPLVVRLSGCCGFVGPGAVQAVVEAIVEVTSAVATRSPAPPDVQ